MSRPSMQPHVGLVRPRRVALLLTAAALACLVLSQPLAAREQRVFHLFGPHSIWNQPLASNAPVASDSRGLSGQLDSFVRASLAAQNGPWINTVDYSTPVYTVPANQRKVPVYMDYNDPSLVSALSAVPIPPGARPAAGSDGELTVIQPSTDTLWEFYDLRQALAPPPFLSAIVTPRAGHLKAGRYYYGVTALTRSGQTTASPVHGYSVPAKGQVFLRWNGPVGAIGYDVYRGSSPDRLRLIGTLSHRTSELEDPNCVWTDDGQERPQPISPPRRDTAKTPGQWHAQWGGRILHVSRDPGYYRTVRDPAGGFVEQDDWGATASGLPVAAGLITLADLASGHIDHAVAIMVPEAAKGVFDFPAQRTDGVDAAANAIPEGAHFRLDPRLNLSRLHLPPVTSMIAEAAQKYGLIVDDQTGVTVGFRAQDPTPLMRAGQPNPYVRYFRNPQTGRYEPPNRLLASFPWSHLELLRAERG